MPSVTPTLGRVSGRYCGASAGSVLLGDPTTYLPTTPYIIPGIKCIGKTPPDLP